MCAMFGWFSDARVWASRVNRASRSGSAAKDVRQDFDRDIAIQLRIARPIHLAHAAFADLGGDFVGAEVRTGSECQVADYTDAAASREAVTPV